MPAAFAHYSFGQLVLEKLQKDHKVKIVKHIDLFHIGLHGPDILFYYKPLKPNHVTKKGHALHRETAKSFLEKAKRKIQLVEDKDGALAYICGFICHFMLDSECHPYVRELEKSGASHNEIETEFERLLLVKNNLDPLSHKSTTHIYPKMEYASCISRFYDEITQEEVLKALKSMKFYLNMLVAPRPLKRSLLQLVLKISGNDGMIGLIMKPYPSLKCSKSSQTLYDIYSNAVLPAAKLMDDFYNGIDNFKEPLNKRFDHTFG